MATKRSVGTLGEADLKGKKVFVRADLNVPLDDAQKITDDTRIRASVPTIKFLLEKGAKVVLASHLGRPKGVTPKYSLKPLVPRLSELLGVDVVMANDCIGEEVSTKIGVIESLLAKVDILILGGGMIYTFYKAQGYAVGKSLVEEDKLELATSLIEKAKAKGVSLLLPTDIVVADKFAPNAESKIVPATAIPDDWMGLDIGPDAIKTFNAALDTTQTIIWNGPMGVFEFEKFAAGTDAIAKKLAELTTSKGVTTIIGGGDSVAAVEKAGLADKMSHISTGGGASLELLEGKPLPGVLALDDA
ncbi:hypothetical protein PVAP13_1KG072100 [Panicum virgatum]|uniref:Phosphoglycerate kinase n=1 Tax=Panicum virgatum TaxID=38727 RepID=A0A8T0XG68_PANVG|nr:hypothetical protein PVAP13_1KG072100 [Panicum virgatum]